ncbi:uncharacterized protein At1g15400-like [Miscanthus floridulus]|uniref:uncharacterized protein At1g15400-like n=1 Tax=Miscanthus floridulus TaxID=154761 RepID=UPI00345945D2
MAELQRSSQTFRRSGSSGLVWDKNRAVDAVLPALDPPSPKVSRCMFCGIFRKEDPSQPSKSKPRRY